MDSKEDDIQWLEEWSGGEVPEIFETLSPQVTHSFREFVEKTYEKKLELVRKAIRSNELTLKFIPNFIIVHILRNFIEPEMAAIIAETLSMDLTLPIIRSLDLEYISQASLHLKPELTAQILEKLGANKSNLILNRILELNPLKTLDVLFHYSQRIDRSKISIKISQQQFQSLHLSTHRKQVLETWLS